MFPRKPVMFSEFPVPRGERRLPISITMSSWLLAVSCNGQNALILRNNGGNGNHWFLVNTVGSRSNRDGICSRIHVIGANGAVRYGIVSAAGSYLSSSDRRVHFGLGTRSLP